MANKFIARGGTVNVSYAQQNNFVAKTGWEVAENFAVVVGTTAAPNGYNVFPHTPPDFTADITIGPGATGRETGYSFTQYPNFFTQMVGGNIRIKENLETAYLWNGLKYRNKITIYLRRPETPGFSVVVPERHYGVGSFGPFALSAENYYQDDLGAVSGEGSVSNWVFPSGLQSPYVVPGFATKLQFLPGVGSQIGGGIGTSFQFLVSQTCALATTDNVPHIISTPVTTPDTSSKWLNGGPFNMYLKIVVYDIDDGYPPPDVDTMPPDPPDTPTGPTTPPGCNGTDITVSWGSVVGATGYRLRQDGIVVYDGTALTAVVSGLTLGVEYTFTIEAYNVDGTSDLSSGLVVTPCVDPPDPPPPVDTPDGPTTPPVWEGVCEGGQLTLRWFAAPGADGYRIYVDGVVAYDGGMTSTVLTGLVAGVDYEVFMTAYNEGGESDSSGTVTLRPCQLTQQDCGVGTTENIAVQECGVGETPATMVQSRF
jgi:hypothetical protein